ncbi:hypothetical protein [Litorimonas sp. WD9-15]|uniref:hypothetical protein n=1 Tax=Litorimonas sp. WD9-15 TaxID=3418716 RepID=UPI003CFE7FF1
MSGFRPGDRIVMIDGVETRLRLTVSALAEIANVTGSDSPAALANRLRQAGRGGDMGVWQGLVSALATPRPAAEIPEDELAKFLPDIAAVIAEGLGA